MKHDAARGELTEGAARYLLVRHDSLMGLFQRLAEPARSEALAAFADSVAEHGGRSAESYRAENPDHLLPKIAEKASQLGWGSWTFELDGESIVLTVRNSPFAQGFGNSIRPVCAPIAGMLRAVTSLLFGAEAAASESSCAAAGGDVCVFRATKRRKLPCWAGATAPTPPRRISPIRDMRSGCGDAIPPRSGKKSVSST